jgi:hypothetical protein
MARLTTTEQVERLSREIERLHGSILDLDRDQQKAKHVLWLMLLVIPAAAFVGPPAAFLVFLFTLSLFATALYLIGVRKREYLGLITDYRRDISRAEASAQKSDA